MNDSITGWLDEETSELYKEKTDLIGEINILDKEQKELEKTIVDFEVRHTKELGYLLLKIFNLKKVIAKNRLQQEPDNLLAQTEYEDAIDEESEYKSTVNSATGDEDTSATENSQELKKAVREITLLIHPDKVNERFKDTAGELFIRVKHAQKMNDWDTINEILEHIKNGLKIPLRNETFSEKDVVISEIKYLQYRVLQITAAIDNIRESEVYRTISDIGDWQAYFTTTRVTLEIELTNLKTRTL